MKDLVNKINHCPPAKLAKILEWMQQTPVSWHPTDLAALLRHQLAAPIDPDLKEAKGRERELQKPGADLSAAARLMTFRDLIRDPHVPLPWLRMMKLYFGGHRSHPDSPIPREVSDTLYFACISLALARHGERITRLDGSTLRKNLEVTARQEWLDDELKPVFQEALRRLAPLSS